MKLKNGQAVVQGETNCDLNVTDAEIIQEVYVDSDGEERINENETWLNMETHCRGASTSL